MHCFAGDDGAGKESFLSGMYYPCQPSSWYQHVVLKVGRWAGGPGRWAGGPGRWPAKKNVYSGHVADLLSKILLVADQHVIIQQHFLWPQGDGLSELPLLYFGGMSLVPWHVLFAMSRLNSAYLVSDGVMGSTFLFFWKMRKIEKN